MSVATRYDAYRKVKAWIAWAVDRDGLTAGTLPPPPRPIRRHLEVVDRLGAYAQTPTGQTAAAVSSYLRHCRADRTDWENSE